MNDDVTKVTDLVGDTPDYIGAVNMTEVMPESKSGMPQMAKLGLAAAAGAALCAAGKWAWDKIRMKRYIKRELDGHDGYGDFDDSVFDDDEPEEQEPEETTEEVAEDSGKKNGKAKK